MYGDVTQRAWALSASAVTVLEQEGNLSSWAALQLASKNPYLSTNTYTYPGGVSKFHSPDTLLMCILNLFSPLKFHVVLTVKDRFSARPLSLLRTSGFAEDKWMDVVSEWQPIQKYWLCWFNFTVIVVIFLPFCPHFSPKLSHYSSWHLIEDVMILRLATLSI